MLRPLAVAAASMVSAAIQSLSVSRVAALDPQDLA